MGRRKDFETDREIERFRREIADCKATIAGTRWPHVADECHRRIRQLRREIDQLQADRRDGDRRAA